MKLVVWFAFLLPFLQSDDPRIRFGSDGIYLDGQKIQGRALTLKDLSSGSVLISETELESLSNEIVVRVGETGTLTIEPGLRATKTENGIQLTTRVGKGIRVIGNDQEIITENTSLIIGN